MSMLQEQSAQEHQKRDIPFWDQIPPRFAFIFGLVAAVALSSVIGLGFTLNALLKSPTANAGLVAQNNPQPSANQPQPPSRDPQPEQAGPVKAVDPKVDHIRGNKDAKVFVIEYSDFECPFCIRHHSTMQKLVDEYKGKVAWVYRHYPLSFHQNAQKEAEASECANELGGNDAFWKFADKIFERTKGNGTGFALDQLVPLAKEIGLNEAKFKTCLDSGKYAQKVQDDMASGSTAGVNGTPGNIIWTKDGKSQLASGAVPIEALKAIIDPLLK